MVVRIDGHAVIEAAAFHRIPADNAIRRLVFVYVFLRFPFIDARNIFVMTNLVFVAPVVLWSCPHF
jgi:hypothetical protein